MQFPQHLLIARRKKAPGPRLPPHFIDPSSLQGHSKVDTVLQVWSQTCQTEGNNHFACPVGYALANIELDEARLHCL